jgi:hypothetical protein
MTPAGQFWESGRVPKIVDLWNAAYFDGRLSPGVLAELRALEDALLAKLGVCARGPDGYLGGVQEDVPADELARCSSILAQQLDDEGFVEQAAAALSRAGRHAWRNHVGHLAMSPVPPPALAPPAV